MANGNNADPEDLDLFVLDIRIQIESLVTRREAMVQENAGRAVKLEPLMFDRSDFMGLSREMDDIRGMLLKIASGRVAQAGGT